MPRVVAAFDKFRGTATASELTASVATAAAAAGWDCDQVPLADGGEGTLAAFGGPNRMTTVTGPLGSPVEAAWRLDRRSAVIEMAQASGLELAGGPADNDPVAATTAGTGELIANAVELGARRLVVGLGGSATTDGGWGAIQAMAPLARLRGVDLLVAADVRTRFLDAAAVFAPQKGASPTQVEFLRRRLERLADTYLTDFGVDVRPLVHGGAAGGLAGGLAAVGATLCEGFDLVADELRLADRLEGADLVVTGEGYLDAESFDGKVVGGVLGLAAELAVPALVIVGDADPDVDPTHWGAATVVSLTERFGADQAVAAPASLVADVVAQALSAERVSEE